MNEQKLTPDQIESLYVFCRKHYVAQYDLQVELVDHLASKIETIWEDDPDISFQQALNTSFGEFGIFGFSKIKVAKEKALRKKYKNLIWSHCLSYFQFPKIILTIGFSLLFFVVLRLIPNTSVLLYIFIGILFCYILIYNFYIFPKYHKIRFVEDKPFLLLETLKRVQSSFAIIPAVLIQLPNILKEFEIELYPLWVKAIISILLSGFSILIFAYTFYIPNKIKEDFMKQYSQFVVA